MKPNVRTAIAYIVGRSVTAKNTSAVYDYDNAQYVSMNGQISGGRINVYDYGSSCYITGSLPGNLYHYGTGNYIQIAIQGNSFSGYDYDTGNYYQGNVSGNSVALYDYEDGRYHNYSV